MSVLYLPGHMHGPLFRWLQYLQNFVADVVKEDFFVFRWVSKDFYQVRMHCFEETNRLYYTNFDK